MRENFLYLVNVLLHRFTDHDFVVEELKGEFPFSADQFDVHWTLESVGCVEESVCHTHKTTETMIECERRLIFVCIINLDLLVSATRVQHRKKVTVPSEPMLLYMRAIS